MMQRVFLLAALVAVLLAGVPARAGTGAKIEDAMLQPPAPAPRVLSGWAEAVSIVRERSTDLKAAYADLERASGLSRTALAGLLPRVNGTGQLTHNVLNKYAPGTPICDSLLGTCSNFVTDDALPRTYLDGAVTLVQPVIDVKAWHELGTSKIAVEAAKLDLESRKRKIVLDLASAIVAIITAERIAELNRNGLRVALERVALAEQRKVLGGGTRLDALRARQDVDAARSTVIAGDEALRQAREALGLALGISGEVGVTPDISLDSLETSTRASCKAASAVDDRSDVSAARVRRDAAERRVTEAKQQFAPRLVGQSLLAFSSLSVEPNPVWNVQAVLSVPIWDGGARYGMLRVAGADAARAEQELVATRRQAEVEIARAQRAVSIASAQRQVYADARAAAVESDDLTQTAFHTGQGTSLELVLAAAQRRQAEINVAVGDFDIVRARVADLIAHARCTF